MKFRIGVSLAAIALIAPAHATDDYLDRLDDFLTVSTSTGAVRARVSGTAELEEYFFPQPAPALIETSAKSLFNPRLTTFLDVQMGPHLYAFAQMRADHGFDPSDEEAQVRLDEYAIRLTPSAAGYLNLQIGKFATVVGNWVARHGSWDSPFVTAPLPYENLTGIWDEVAARSSATLLNWAHIRPLAERDVPATDKYLRLPIIWGPSYATGFALSGEMGKVTYAAEVKNAALASRPTSWVMHDFHWSRPTVSGRLGFRPNQMWNFGFSASEGAYLRPAATPTVPAGVSIGDYREIVFAQDVGFAWHHVQVWAEFFETRFKIPRVADADTFAYYVEARYKFTPQLFGALRWNEQLFGRIPDGTAETRWGANTRRLDFAAGYRFTPHTQLKFQYSLQYEEIGPREVIHVLSTQLTLRF